MRLHSTRARRAAIATVALLAFGVSARAEDFYKNKTITIVCPASAGLSYDLYARFMASNIGRFIPGNPKIIVENRSGAGSRIATTHVYNVAPRDGTVIGNSTDTLPFDETIFPGEGHYDMTKVQYLGNLVALTGVMAISKAADVVTLDDVKRKEVIIGANGTSSITYTGPMIINALSGTKFKIVNGYNGSADIDLAIAKGEVKGRGGSWQSFRSLHPDWIASGEIKALFQYGLVEDPYMKGVPRLVDYATNDEQKAIYTVLSQLSQFSRAYWVSPDVPADRVAILRKAFFDMASDPDVLKEATRQTIDILPTPAEDIQAAITQLKAITPAMAEHIRQILR